jgi:hypothetical protein
VVRQDLIRREIPCHVWLTHASPIETSRIGWNRPDVTCCIENARHVLTLPHMRQHFGYIYSFFCLREHQLDSSQNMQHPAFA